MTIHQADRLPSDIKGYHQRTKHAPNRYALGPAFLDWTSQPSPYRSFAGSPRIMLPLLDGADTPSFPGPAPRRGEARSRCSGIVSRTRVRPQRLEERRGIDLGAAQQSLERQSASDGSLGILARDEGANGRRSIITRRSITRWNPAPVSKTRICFRRAAFCWRSAPSLGGRHGNMASAPIAIVSSTPAMRSARRLKPRRRSAGARMSFASRPTTK